MPTTTPSKPASGIESYEKFLAVLHEELDRSLKPLKDDLRELKEAQANVYSREMMDERLKAINERLGEHSEDLKGIHNLIGNSGRELLERVAVVASIAYALVYVIPHFFH